MTTHKVATREEWLAAGGNLLPREKELPRRGDQLAAERRELPWVPIEKEYSFGTDEGPKTLRELFGGRSQLIAYHFMFGPAYTAGCPVCSSAADTFNGAVPHLNARDVTFTCVSRAPLGKLQAYKRRMGWSFPWASSYGSDFNYDFSTSVTEEQQREGIVEYNFGQRDIRPVLEAADGPVGEFAAMTGTDAATYLLEAPGMSAFALEDGVVYHTYSAYARGVDAMWGMYPWLCRAPEGRY